MYFVCIENNFYYKLDIIIREGLKMYQRFGVIDKSKLIGNKDGVSGL